jgi:hypothetical protein
MAFREPGGERSRFPHGSQISMARRNLRRHVRIRWEQPSAGVNAARRDIEKGETR